MPIDKPIEPMKLTIQFQPQSKEQEQKMIELFDGVIGTVIRGVEAIEPGSAQRMQQSLERNGQVLELRA
jgi:flagellin-specific chaperone FliS